MNPFESLAQRCGIVESYVNAHGDTVQTSEATRKALLGAMGFDVADPAKMRRALEELDQKAWLLALPPVTVHRTHGPPRVELTLRADARRVEWRLTLENGRARRRQITLDDMAIIASRTVQGVKYVKRWLHLPAGVPYGYHTLRVEPGGASMMLIVAPAKCWLPDESLAGERLWGVSTQLYLMRSRQDWGIGDFGDLRKLVGIVAPLGADVIGLNPLHASFLNNPEHASPYSPASRLLLNVLYIDIAALARELDNSAAKRWVAAPAFRRRLQQVRDADEVQYAAVTQLKVEVLRLLFDGERQTPRSVMWRAFQTFEREASAAVRRACLFLALLEHFATQGKELADWHHWPSEFRDPDSKAVAKFAREHAVEVQFQIWLQFAADRQLATAAHAARDMAIGLYRDLAVGADSGGAETWANQRAVISGAHVGAPPDIYIPSGQDWGLPPFDPRALRDEAYRSFIDLVRANMRHAGGLRIDHVMALLHLYWVPKGSTPAHGTYVDYPLDDLVGILALESQRAQCIVVGEDLGTVPAGFRERMAAANILSYRVLFFERDGQAFLPPERYPDLAMAVVGSHDLPTLRSWWEAGDLDLKNALGLFAESDLEQAARTDRDSDKGELQKALRREGLAGDTLDTEALMVAAHAYLARSPCILALAQIDDITREIKPVNVPTVESYPNWRRRLSMTLEDLAQSPRLANIVAVFARERGARPD